MGFVVVRDHYRIGDGLRDHVISVVLDGKNNLEAQFLVLVATITSDPHGQLYLH